MFQARSSYLPNEVLWGYRFVNLLTFKHSASQYKIDYSAFNSVYKTELSPLSQKVKVWTEFLGNPGHIFCLIQDEISDGDQASDDEDTEAKCQAPGHQTPLPHSATPLVSRSAAQVFPAPATPTLDTRTHNNINNINFSDNGKKYCVEVLHMVWCAPVNLWRMQGYCDLLICSTPWKCTKENINQWLCSEMKL